MKSAQVLRLEALTSLVRNREGLDDEALLDLLRGVLGCGRSPSARRSKRYRDGKRSSDTPSSVTNRDEPTRPSVTNDTPKRDERHASVTPIAPIPSSPPGPPSDSLAPPDLPKAAAVAAEGSDRNHAQEAPAAAPRDWLKSPPKNLDEAREMPLEERCRHVLERPDRAQWIQPEQWPEVRLAASAFREAVKRPRMPLGRFDSDAGVKRLVELYAAGLTAEEVCGAIPAVVASAWFRSDPPKDLGSLTLTVVRRALDAQPAPAIDGLPRAMFGGGS